MTADVVRFVESPITRAEVERSRRRQPGDLAAYDHFLRAIAFSHFARATASKLRDSRPPCSLNGGDKIREDLRRTGLSERESRIDLS